MTHSTARQGRAGRVCEAWNVTHARCRHTKPSFTCDPARSAVLQAERVEVDGQFLAVLEPSVLRGKELATDHLRALAAAVREGGHGERRRVRDE
eukprot:5276863-Prymnesium_polylepis.2